MVRARVRYFATATKIVFNKKGDCYEIIFGEKSIPPIKTSKGLVYIEHLLKRPNFDIHVMELERLINKSMPQSPDISVSEIEDMGLQISENFTKADMADKKTIKAVRAQIAHISESLDIANENGDLEQAEQLIEEKNRYEDYLRGVIGLHGKPRKIPDEKEKARKRVWYAITNAIKKTHQYHPGLSDYLTNSVRLGEFCTYKPFVQSDF